MTEQQTLGLYEEARHFAIQIGGFKVEFPDGPHGPEFQANEPIMDGEDSPGFGLIIVGTSVATQSHLTSLKD